MAGCWFVSGYGVVSNSIALPTLLEVQNDTAVGTVLWDSGWKGGGATRVKCDGSSNVYWVGLPSGMVANQSGASKTYYSNIAENKSIGVRVSFSNSPDYNKYGGVLDPANQFIFGADTYVPSSYYRVELISLGNVTSGALNFPSPMVQLKYNGLITNQLIFSNVNIRVKSYSCNVSSKNIDLGNIAARDLISPGDATDYKNFSLDFTACSIDTTKFSATFTGEISQLNSGMFSNAGTAKNIAIDLKEQLTESSIINNSTLMGDIDMSTNSYTLPLKVRAVAPIGNVYPGTISGVLAVTIKYQ